MEWQEVSRRPRSSSLGEEEEAFPPNRRSQSAGSETEMLGSPRSPDGNISRSWSAGGSLVAGRSASASASAQRNARRRRRKKAAFQQEEEATALAARREEDLSKELKKTRKSLRSIGELVARKVELSAEQARKVERRDALEANRSALEARLAAIREERERQDSIVAALDAVSFDPSFECGVCFEVVELPTRLVPCGHEFCRACAEAVVKRAARGGDLICPLCRANFYDGANKVAKLAPATATRQKLKKLTGTCHCGQIVPLSSLRDHLRKCGPAAACYEPRQKFGHDFAKPDFPRALASQKNERRGDDDALGPLAAAIVRRFERETNGGASPILSPRPPRDSSPPPPLLLERTDENDAPPLGGGEEDNPRPPEAAPDDANHDDDDDADAARGEEEDRKEEEPVVVEAPPKLSLREIMLEEEAKAKTATKTKTKTTPRRESTAPLQGEGDSGACTQVPLAAFLPARQWAPAVAPPQQKKASWSPVPPRTPLRPDKPPSVHEILAEEASKRKDLAERQRSPWAGAVARHLRENTAPPPPNAAPPHRSSKVH